MRGKKELFKELSVKTGAVVLATAIVFGTGMWAEKTQTPIPELVTFVDTEGSISISEEEVPLAKPEVTISTKTSKKTKKIKMKTASKKTYSKMGSTKKKTTTKKTKSSSQTTTTKTVTTTSVMNKYKKGSNINTQVTTTKTTVTKTVVSNENGSQTTKKSTTSQTKSQSVSASDVTIEASAAAVDSRVMNAYNSLGFKVKVNPNVSYSGLFDAKTRTITLKKQDDTIYHELGHFVAFVAGNVDKSSSFQQVYASEKSKYTAYNKAYVLSSSSEYFAESFKNYTQNPGALQSSRPQTYAAIVAALNTITNDHIARIANTYKAVWK